MCTDQPSLCRYVLEFNFFYYLPCSVFSSVVLYSFTWTTLTRLEPWVLLLFDLIQRPDSILWHCTLVKNVILRVTAFLTVFTMPKQSLHISVIYVQSKLLFEKLMIDTMKSFNSGYELMKYVNINRLLFDNNQVLSDWGCLKLKCWRVSSHS